MASTIESVNQVRWDLSILYSDIADPRLDSDLRELTDMARHFSETYKGNLAERLGAALKDYSERATRLAVGKHTPHMLTESLSWHSRYLRSGHMLRQDD